MLTNEFDVLALRGASQMVQKFTSAPVWKDYIIAPSGPSADVSLDSNEQLDTFIRSTAGSACHGVGTNKMTARNSGFGVVDPDLKVKGTAGLRVVDASVLVSLLIIYGYLLILPTLSHLYHQHTLKLRRMYSLKEQLT